MEGDRTYPVWAFLLGSGLRIGELVWLRWGNVDLLPGSLQPAVEIAPPTRHIKTRDTLRHTGFGEKRPQASLARSAAVIGVEGDDQTLGGKAFE
jgi:hypothetical protein